MITLSPGSSTWWNLPRRSTIQAFCCGTTRTPSITNTAASATMKKGIANGRDSGKKAMMMVAMTTPRTFASMLSPVEREISLRPCVRSGGPGLGNFERVAIDRIDVENFAALAGDIARDLRVPKRIAVPYACLAGVLVHPRIERGRLAKIQSPHTFGFDRFLVPSNPDYSANRDRRRDQRLPGEHAARVRQARAGETGNTKHEQIERARHQLDDDEDEAGDQPDEEMIYGHVRQFLIWNPILCRLK